MLIMFSTFEGTVTFHTGAAFDFIQSTGPTVYGVISGTAQIPTRGIGFGRVTGRKIDQ